jgi:hypothetical protein
MISHWCEFRIPAIGLPGDGAFFGHQDLPDLRFILPGALPDLLEVAPWGKAPLPGAGLSGFPPRPHKAPGDIRRIPVVPEQRVRRGERSGPGIPVQPPGPREPVDGVVDPFDVRSLRRV